MRFRASATVLVLCAYCAASAPALADHADVAPWRLAQTDTGEPEPGGDAVASPDSGPMTAEQQRQVLQRIDRKLVDGRYDDAHALALRHRFELEGEPRFDFYYGLAALETGNTSEAIFALERVVSQEPDFTRARLELARAQFESGDHRRAQRHFEQVLAQDPPPPIEATIEQYLLAISNRADRYSTVVTAWVEAGIGHDTNVNSATNADSIPWVFSDQLGDIPLGDEDQELADEFWRFAALGRVSRPLARRVNGFVQADFEERRNFTEGDFNTRRLATRFGTVLHGEHSQTELSVRLQRFWLDGDAYQDRAGLAASSRYRLRARTALLGSLQWSRLRYDELELRDSDLWLASGGLSHVWGTSLRPVGSLSAFLGEESARESGDAAAAQASRDLYGAGARLRLTPAPAWHFTTSLQYRRSEYGAENPLFDKTREDDYYQLDFELYWQSIPHRGNGQSGAHWRVGPHVRFIDNDSNIELFDYDGQVVELRARYNF